MASLPANGSEETQVETQSIVSLSDGLKSMTLENVGSKSISKKDDKRSKVSGGGRHHHRQPALKDIEEKHLMRKLKKRHAHLADENEMLNWRKALKWCTKHETTPSVESPNRRCDGSAEHIVSSLGHQDSLSPAAKKRKHFSEDNPETASGCVLHSVPEEEVEDSLLKSVLERLGRFPPDMRRVALKKIQRLLNRMEFGKKAIRRKPHVK